LKEIIEMVERSYDKGVPKHRLASARSPTFDPKASAIFVVSWDDFLKIPPKDIQDIFRRRHILITETPVSTLEFNEEGLSTLAPLHQKNVFQGG
jgi:hypothetical protein